MDAQANQQTADQQMVNQQAGSEHSGSEQAVDDRLAAAISHWAPRFTMNGVTAADFDLITGGLREWADWCAAWNVVAAEHEQLGRDALAAGRLDGAGPCRPSAPG